MSPAQPDAVTGADLPRAVREVVDLLRQEHAAVAEMLDSISSLAIDEPDVAEVELEHLAEELTRFAEASEAAGFSGLRRVLEFAAGNVGLLAAAPPPRSLRPAADLLAGTGDYLADPGAAPPSEQLAALLDDADWLADMAADDRSSILEALLAPDLDAMASDHPPRPTQATAADLTLEVSERVEPELLDSLLFELPAQTAEFSARIQSFSVDADAADVDAARRIAHTIKGAANTVGVPGVAMLTHQLEDILDEYSKQQRIPAPPILDTLIQAADCLEAMAEALAGSGPAPEDALAVLQSILDWANRIDEAGLPDEADRRPLAPGSVPGSWAGGDRDTDAEMASGQDVDAAAASRPALRVSAERIDELLALMGENIILTGQVQEGLKNGVQDVRGLRELFGQVQQLAYDLEQMVEIRGLSGPRARAVGEDFDPLEMDEFNEFHSLSSRLAEAATDAREMLDGLNARLTALDGLLVGQSRLNRESQDAVMLTRMLPVSTIVGRLQRTVRQTARLTGKSVQMSLSGESTLIDSGVLADLVDPLMHLLRNAVDHGLESADERLRLDKPESGRIALAFGREGAQVVVSCSDDGAGLDLAAIQAAAEAKGWLAPAQTIDEPALSRLVFRPGLTTRAHATQMSGRGIGMDVVHSTIVGLGGSVELSSEPGAGCRVRMRLPISVITTHAILLRVDRQLLAIANRGIEQILYGGSGELQEVDGELRFAMEGVDYPAIEVERLLGRVRVEAASSPSPRNVLLVQGDTGLQAVVVGSIFDSRDVVIKATGRYLPRLPGIAGATILGDGTVAPVMDLPDLLRSASARELPLDSLPASPVEPETVGLPGALIVDDSLSARRSMRRIMEEIGFQVRTARDGLEAVALMADFRPEIILLDLEMPRMNGLELCAHIRAQPDMAALPIVMVTSRSTLKHRQQAREAGVDAYFTKPIAEDDLFDTVGRLYRKP